MNQGAIGALKLPQGQPGCLIALALQQTFIVAAAIAAGLLMHTQLSRGLVHNTFIALDALITL